MIITVSLENIQHLMQKYRYKMKEIETFFFLIELLRFTLLTIFVFNIQLVVFSNLNLVASVILSRQVGIQAETWMGRYNFWNLLLIKRI